MKFLLISFFFFLFLGCRYNDVDHYFHKIFLRDFNNKRISLQEIQNPVFLMNFYSPTCAPCIEELPTLHLIYNQIQRYNFDLFLVVEPDLEKNVPYVPIEFQNKNFDENSMQYLLSLLKEEKIKRNIQIPMYVVEPPFKIDRNQIVTGTPETLIFTTNPLRLHYNFIGPIATSKDLERIKNNTRYIFLVQMLEQFYQNNLNKEIKNPYSN